MSLFSWFKDRWKHEAVHSTYEFLDAAHVEGRSIPAGSIRSGEQYLRLTLAEMFLKNDREWFTAYTPAVYSAVSLTFGNSKEELSHVAGPSGLKDLKAGAANRSVTLNYPLTPLVPFNGGDIELELGLVALPGSNDAKRLLKVLTDFSTSLAVPQISLALSFAQPLVSGITELVGAEDTKLVLRLHDTFTAATLQAGYWVVVGAPTGALSAAQMWVKNDRLHYGPTAAAATALTGYDYALFRLDALAERDDYQALTAIGEPYQAAIDALSASIQEPDPQKQKDKLLEAERLLGAAKLAAYKSKELTFKAGRRQVIEALQKGFNEAKGLLGSGAAEQNVAATLARAMAGAMSAKEAVLAGEVSIRDLE